MHTKVVPSIALTPDKYSSQSTECARTNQPEHKHFYPSHPGHAAFRREHTRAGGNAAVGTAQPPAARWDGS